MRFFYISNYKIMRIFAFSTIKIGLVFTFQTVKFDYFCLNDSITRSKMPFI